MTSIHSHPHLPPLNNFNSSHLSHLLLSTRLFLDSFLQPSPSSSSSSFNLAPNFYRRHSASASIEMQPSSSSSPSFHHPINIHPHHHPNKLSTVTPSNLEFAHHRRRLDSSHKPSLDFHLFLYQAIPLSIRRSFQFIILNFKFILLLLLLIVLLYWWFIETHIQIAFYSRSSITQLLPPHPPPLSSRCFSAEFLRHPFDLRPHSFPSSPAYNTSLGTLGLQPKVLSLSPGFRLPHHDDCYRFASTIPFKPTEAMIRSNSLDLNQVSYYHLYWRSDLLPISDRQIITLKSLLATQDFQSTSTSAQPTSQLILWTNPSTRSLENDPILAPLLYRYRDRLTLKVLDLESLTHKTPLEGLHLLDHIFDRKAWLDGDLVRVLVLWHFGGYWIDMDNLILRDLQVLGEHEWVVQWDCYDKPYEPLNGHMMHFLKHSPYLCEMMEMMSKPPWPRPASTDWGGQLYHRLYRSLLSSGVTPFKVLPYCLTDGRSCDLKHRIPDPFLPFLQPSTTGKTTTTTNDPKTGQAIDDPESDWDLQLTQKLKYLFSIHLHNQWEKQFPKDGWVHRLYINRWDSIIS